MYLTQNLLKKNITNKNITIACSFIGFASLTILTLGHLQAPFWDEEWYLRNIPLLEQYGLSEQFLMKYWGPAGPLYAFVHFAFEPVTQLKAPWVRIVNVILLGFSILFIWLTLRLTKQVNPFALSLALLSIPMIYVCAGLALTEIPAMMFIAMAILLLLYSLQHEHLLFKVLMGIAGGLALGLSILGRQPYLVVAFASVIFILKDSEYKRNLLSIIPFLIGAIILPAIVFRVWGNIQPPIEDHTGVGLSLFHGF